MNMILSVKNGLNFIDMHVCESITLKEVSMNFVPDDIKTSDNVTAVWAIA